MIDYLKTMLNDGTTFVLDVFFLDKTQMLRCGLIACDSTGLIVEYNGNTRLVTWAGVDYVEVEGF